MDSIEVSFLYEHFFRASMEELTLIFSVSFDPSSSWWLLPVKS